MTVIYALRLKKTARDFDDELVATVKELRAMDTAIRLYFDMLEGKWYPPPPKGERRSTEINLGAAGFGHLKPELTRDNYSVTEELAANLVQATKAVHLLRERLAKLRPVFPEVELDTAESSASQRPVRPKVLNETPTETVPPPAARKAPLREPSAAHERAAIIDRALEAAAERARLTKRQTEELERQARLGRGLFPAIRT
jgi:hypothetical protein